MRLCIIAFGLLSLVRTGCYGLVIIDSTIASACIYYEDQYDWGCDSHTTSGHGGKYKCRCTNINWLQTTTNCIHNATTEKHLLRHAFKHIIKRCSSKANIDLTLDQMYNFYENGTKYLRRPTDFDYNTSVVGTLELNQTQFDWYHAKFKEYTVFVKRSQWFGWGLVLYWTFIICVATFFNLNKRIFGFKLKPSMNNMISKRLIIPSVYKGFHERTYFLFRFIPLNFPTRLHTIIVTIFVILTIIFVGVGYNVTLPHPLLTTRWYANLNLLSYRTDLMAISLFPLIYFFGIRNNPFIPLTGLSFATFNFYHKWCAYVCTSLAFIHSIIWTVWETSQGHYSASAREDYWKWGIAATTLLFLLIFHSEKIVRDFMYEFFLILHNCMNIVFIIAMYYHLVPMGWKGWVWSMIGIYAFDRVMRVTRIILNGGYKDAKLEDCEDGVIKMTIKKPKFLNYQAGSFAYVYFLSLTNPWFYVFQSHPFTVIKDPTNDESNSTNLIFYFKAHKGITRVMLKKLLKSGEKSISCKILLEGPYGWNIPQIRKIERNYVGVAAGLGITAIYPHLSEINMAGNETPSNNIFSIKLYWILRNSNYPSWFLNELNRLKSRGCEVIIISTGDSVDNIDIESKNSSTERIENEGKGLTEFAIENLQQRPDLLELVKREIKLSSEQGNDITFFSCGPSMFNDSFRVALTESLDMPTNVDVKYCPESFVW